MRHDGNTNPQRVRTGDAMNAAELQAEIERVAPRLRSRIPVLFRVPALPLEAGDKLPLIAEYDADGSLVLTVDTRTVELVRR